MFLNNTLIAKGSDKKTSRYRGCAIHPWVKTQGFPRVPVMESQYLAWEQKMLKASQVIAAQPERG